MFVKCADCFVFFHQNMQLPVVKKVLLMNNFARYQQGATLFPLQKHLLPTHAYMNIRQDSSHHVHSTSTYRKLNTSEKGWYNLVIPYNNIRQIPAFCPLSSYSTNQFRTYTPQDRFFSSAHDNSVMENQYSVRKRREDYLNSYAPEDTGVQMTNEKLQKIDSDFQVPEVLPGESTHVNSITEVASDQAMSVFQKTGSSSPFPEELPSDNEGSALDQASQETEDYEKALKEKAENISRSIQQLRRWRYTSYGKFHQQRPRSGVEFTLMSYNILAQQLLHDNCRLYRHCEPRILNWEYRCKNLLQEIQELQCDVICLQEVQADHYYHLFKPAFESSGYHCLYKKRTGGKCDGCAIIFKTSMFVLLDHQIVEFHKPGMSLLNRDNVGIIAMLKPKFAPPDSDSKLCIATTHLLYNPRRGDIKLAQLRLLLAEIDKMAFKRLSHKNKSVYYPIILCGDMNTEPYSPLYEFITDGELYCKDLLSGDISGQEQGANKGRPLDLDELLYPELEIMEDSRYVGVCEMRGIKDIRKPDEVRNVEKDSLQQETQLSTPEDHSNEVSKANQEESDVQLLVSEDQPNDISEAAVSSVRTESLSSPEILYHYFNFVSIYKHYSSSGQKEITTNHLKGNCTVDYIFYSVKRRHSPVQSDHHHHRSEGLLRLLAKYRLLTDQEITEVGGLPNACQSSDHLSLVCRFLLKCS